MQGLYLGIDGLLILTAAAMLLFGKYGITRELALAPLTTAVLDGFLSSAMDFSLTPWLSAAVVLLQGVILAFSGLMLYQDRVHFRNKQLRRKREQDLAKTRRVFEEAEARRIRATAAERSHKQACA